MFLVALYPGVSLSIVDAIHRKTAAQLNFTSDDAAHLMAKTAAYISDRARPTLSHPSYREAIVALLKEQYEHSVAKIVDMGLAEVARTDTFALSRCAAADYGWLRYAPGEPVNIREYLTQFLSAYNAIRNRVFTTLKPRLAPYNPAEASCIFLIYPDSTGGELLIVPSRDGAERLFVEQPTNVGASRDEITQQARQALTHQTVYTVQTRDLVRRAPQMHAFSMIRDEIRNIFEKQRLQEGWPITYARLERYLSDSDWKLLGVTTNPDAPFGSADLPPLFRALDEAENKPPPEYLHPIAWQAVLQRFAFLPIALVQCVEALEANGKQYTGRLLPQPDLEFTPSCHNYESLYSPTQMEKLIRRRLELKCEAYQYMIEANFASIKHLMKKPYRLPTHVVGAATYNNQIFGSWAKFIYLPPTFPTLTGEDFELYVFSGQRGNYNSPPPLPAEVEKRMQEVEASDEWYTITGGTLIGLSDLKSLVDSVYKWIREDVENAMDWDEVGRERSDYFAGIAYEFAASNPGKSLYTDLTYTNDAFDWPSM